MTTKATEAALAGEELPDGVTLGETKTNVLPKVKQIMRYFAGAGVQPNHIKGHYSGEEIDEYLGYWVDVMGYELFATHYLGDLIVDVETGAKAFGFMYVLILKE